MEGVDPALVFRIRAVGRLSAEDWSRRGLELLAEGADWDYVVLSEGAESPAFSRALAAYARAPDEEGAKAPLSSFFGELEAIEAYGPDDRLLPEVAAARDDLPGPVDIVIWPASNDAEAAHRVEQVTAAVAAVKGSISTSDQRARSPVVRAILDGDGTRQLATVPVVETIRLPVLPYVDPSAWRDARYDDLTVEQAEGAPIGVLDDAIATGHPLLNGLVQAIASFPEGRTWEQPAEHGTMVAGLAAYGDLKSRFARVPYFELVAGWLKGE